MLYVAARVQDACATNVAPVAGASVAVSTQCLKGAEAQISLAPAATIGAGKASPLDGAIALALSPTGDGMGTVVPVTAGGGPSVVTFMF
jgi:hypothetical protein